MKRMTRAQVLALPNKAAGAILREAVFDAVSTSLLTKRWAADTSAKLWLAEFPPKPDVPKWDAFRLAAVRNLLAGCVKLSYARSTGLLVGVYSADQGADFSSEDGGKWACVCESHGSILQSPTREIAMSWSSASEEWCEECRGRA